MEAHTNHYTFEAKRPAHFRSQKAATEIELSSASSIMAYLLLVRCIETQEPIFGQPSTPLKRRTTVLTLRGHKDSINCLSYSPDGRYLASGSDDQSVRLWNLAEGGEQAPILERGISGSVTTIAFSLHEVTLLAGTSEGDVCKWAVPLQQQTPDTGQRKPSKKRRESATPPLILVGRIRAHVDGVRAMINADLGEDFLITAGMDQIVKVWVAATFEEGATLHQDRPIAALAISPARKILDPNQRILAVGDVDGNIRFYDCESGEVLKELRTQLPLLSLAWSSRNHLLASGHGDGTILLSRANSSATTQPRGALHGHDGIIFSLAWTPDGRTLISGGADGTVRLWDVASGRERHCYRWHTSWVTCLAVAPDGMTAAAGSADHTIVLWDLDDN